MRGFNRNRLNFTTFCFILIPIKFNPPCNINPQSLNGKVTSGTNWKLVCQISVNQKNAESCNVPDPDWVLIVYQLCLEEESMKKNRLTLYLLIVVLLFLGCATPIVQIQASHSETSSLYEVEPFIDGSNQEWAMDIFSQFDNGEEKIRLYNFLLQAYTYLMIYDRRDYLEEYNHVKELWLGWVEDYPDETARQQEAHDEINQLLDDEAWIIDISYPLERPFDLTDDEFVQVFFTFRDANPQFSNHPMFAEIAIPVTYRCENGLNPRISILAYWAFEDRRQEAYEYFRNTFEPVPWQPRDFWGEWSNQQPPPVIIHVSPDQVETAGVGELEGAEEPGGNNDSSEDSEHDQGQATLRRNLILFSTLGAFLLLVTTIIVIRRKKASKEPDVSEESLEEKKQETEINAKPMVTVTCNFCGARINVVKGKSQKCPYCDCIISGMNED